MRPDTIRRLVIALLALVILGLFTAAAAAAGAVTSGQVILAIAGFMLGYVVIRLSETLYVADAERRRRARRHLMMASVVPALLVAPSVMGSAPDALRPAIIIGALVWMCLALAYTSFIVARTGDARGTGAAPSARRARIHLPARFVSGRFAHR